MAKTQEIINRIVAKTQADGGATYNLKHDRMVQSADIWLYPQFPGLTKVMAADKFKSELEHFLNDYATVLDNDDLYLGTWINPDNNKYYIDVIAYADSKDEALAKAQHLSKDQGRQVISIYNPATHKVVEL